MHSVSRNGCCPSARPGAASTGFDVANLAIQVHGGHGYVKESGVEQYVRDVRIAGIYEGTNGIQAIDLLQRKLVGDAGVRLNEWLRENSEAISAERLANPALRRIDDAARSGC